MTPDPFYVLDLTRAASRVGRGPATGIDRVERAWLEGLLERKAPMAGLVRISSGYCWMDTQGCRYLFDLAEGRVVPGAPDALSRLSLRVPGIQRAVESELRRRATGRVFRGGLARLLAAHMPEGATYLNLGHSHLDEPALACLAGRGRVVAMIHDTIPLSLPSTQRPGTPERFGARIRAVAAHAEVVLVPSRAAAEEVAPHVPGREIHVVPLGVALVEPDLAGVRSDLPLEHPFMLSVGTIDPRKNQEMLLDIWRKDAVGLPPLVLVGARGWGPPELHRRLDAPPRGVHILHDLPDGAVAALMERATALLHPSLAEGYGLPPLEAALRGTPVIVSEIPAHRETLGDNAVYLNPTDGYQWKSAIKALGNKGPPSRTERDRAIARLDRPTWETHLNLALTRLG